jgi:hypothetical protein
MVDGDNRKPFIKKHKGYQLHHLYFWVLADECGMLKNVLNILSAEVSGDSDNVPGDTALTKRARLGLSRTSSPSDGGRADKKKYHQDVAAALEVIGKGMTDFNKMKDYSIGLHHLSITNDAIAHVRNSIRAEEASIQKFRVALIVATTQEEKDLFASKQRILSSALYCGACAQTYCRIEENKMFTHQWPNCGRPYLYALRKTFCNRRRISRRLTAYILW